MNSFAKKKGLITFTVDYRTELLSVILVLSDFSFEINFEDFYKNEMVLFIDNLKKVCDF